MTKINFIPPTLIVSTGNGFHCYGSLAVPLPTTQWKSIQERLNTTLGADGATNKLAGLMRLPGYVNTKAKDNLKDVTLLEINGKAVYKIEQIEKCLVIVPNAVIK